MPNAPYTPPGQPAAFHTTGQNRSGFDDSQWIRDWHRRQGPALAMTDIDAVYCESRGDVPVALIEYKRFTPRVLEETNALLQFGNLATLAGLPAYIVFYDHTPAFVVRPWNDEAVARRGRHGDQRMTEREFVTWLYQLRGLSLPDRWPFTR